MSTINSVTYNAGSGGTDGVYSPGDPIIATVDYTADTPSVVASPFTVTTTVTNAGGTVTATNDSTFTVNEPQAGGDTVAVADSGNHAWTQGTTTPQSDGSLSVPFSTTA